MTRPILVAASLTWLATASACSPSEPEPQLSPAQLIQRVDARLVEYEHAADSTRQPCGDGLFFGLALSDASSADARLPVKLVIASQTLTGVTDDRGMFRIDVPRRLGVRDAQLTTFIVMRPTPDTIVMTTPAWPGFKANPVLRPNGRSVPLPGGDPRAAGSWMNVYADWRACPPDSLPV